MVNKSHPDYSEKEMGSEIQIAKLVSGHPNIANLVDVFVDQANWYLVQVTSPMALLHPLAHRARLGVNRW